MLIASDLRITLPSVVNRDRQHSALWSVWAACRGSGPWPCEIRYSEYSTFESLNPGTGRNQVGHSVQGVLKAMAGVNWSALATRLSILGNRFAGPITRLLSLLSEG
jgi:hypothetical protein